MVYGNFVLRLLLRIEASETAQIKAYKHIVSFLDAKGKTGLLDDINKVYEREKERRGL